MYPGVTNTMYCISENVAYCDNVSYCNNTIARLQIKCLMYTSLRAVC